MKNVLKYHVLTDYFLNFATFFKSCHIGLYYCKNIYFLLISMDNNKMSNIERVATFSFIIVVIIVKGSHNFFLYFIFFFNKNKVKQSAQRRCCLAFPAFFPSLFRLLILFKFCLRNSYFSS